MLRGVRQVFVAVLAPLALSTAQAAPLDLFGSAETQLLRRQVAQALEEREGAPTEIALGVLSEDRIHSAPWWNQAGAVALLERRMSGPRRAAYRRQLGAAPLALGVAADAAAMIVHPVNPIPDRGMSTQQLQAVLSARGSELRFWGGLGLADEWRLRPIAVVVRRAGRSTALVRDLLLDGDPLHPRVAQIPGAGPELLSAIERDQNALGLVSLGASLRGVGVVPLSRGTSQAPVVPAREQVAAGRYPLAGCVYLYFARNPRQVPVGPAQAAIARFLLGDGGQRILAENGFLELSPASKRLARGWLEAAAQSAADAPPPPQCRRGLLVPG